MNINDELKKYVEDNILIKYKDNQNGHGIGHINYVIDRSIKFASTIEDINFDMVYVVASYHDLGHSINPDNHEVVSAQMLVEDLNLKKYFSEEEIIVMKEAIEDHRASSNNVPRNIYGKIVSSADRNTSVEEVLRRSYLYRINKRSFKSLDEVIEECHLHLSNKFGRGGYAQEKMYFDDKDYRDFLEELDSLLNDKEAFSLLFKSVNNL